MTANDDNIERCFICAVPFKAGDMVLGDVNEGLGHRACFGEDREGYHGEDGGPLRDGEDIPSGYAWEPDPAVTDVETAPISLEPCPHCGEKDHLYPAYHGMGEGKPYAIDCVGCGADFTPREGIDVIAAWNRRASPPTAGVTDEMVEAALKAYFPGDEYVWHSRMSDDVNALVAEHMRSALTAALPLTQAAQPNIGVVTPLGWVVFRDVDPTFPRFYRWEHEADAMIAAVTVGPLAEKVAVRALASQERSNG